MAALEDLRRFRGGGLAYLVLDGAVTAITAAQYMALTTAEVSRALVRFSLGEAMDAATVQRRAMAWAS